MMQKHQSIWQLTKSFLILFIFLFTELSIGSPGYLNLQSRISKPDSAGYLEANSVQFRMTVTDPVGTCVLFQEEFANVDMTDSKGLINFKVGSGTKVYPAGPMAMPSLFTNFNSPIFNCQSGGTYTAASSDARKLVMQFNDGSGWQTVPSMEINSIPFALESLASQKLGTYPAADYVRTAQFTSCTGTQAVHFNGTNFTCIALSSGSAYSAITGATGTNAIDNTNYAQTWDWSTATTQNPMTMTANALTTGSLLNLTTSNNSLNSTNGLLNVANTGSSTSGMVARIQSNTNAGSGLTVLANGNVGIGTTSPGAALHVVGANGTAGSPAGTQGITVTAGSAFTATGDGGGVSVQAGNADNGAGGSVSIGAGQGLGGGSLMLRGGATWSGVGASSIELVGSGSITGGGVTISSGGTAGNAPGNSGHINIVTPSTTTGSTAVGGSINLTAGNGELAGAGGTVNVTAGSGGASNVNGSNVVLNGGAKGGTGLDGNVVLANARGNVGIGTTTPTVSLQISKDIGAGVNSDGLIIQTASNSPNWYGPIIVGRTSQGTIAAPTGSLDGDYGLSISGQVKAGSGGFVDAGKIVIQADGNTSWNDVGGRILFQTTPNGITPVDRMIIRSNGNVGIGTTTPGASSLLDLTSTTKGLVLSRMTKAQRDLIAAPVAGMAVYQTDNTPGLRVYNGSNWMRFTETAD